MSPELEEEAFSGEHSFSPLGRINASEVASLFHPEGLETASVDEIVSLLDPLDNVLSSSLLTDSSVIEPATTFDILRYPWPNKNKWTNRIRSSVPSRGFMISPSNLPTEKELPWCSLRDIAYFVACDKISANEVLRSYMDVIESLQPRLNAYITINPCCVSDSIHLSGRLAGVPVALKDLIDTAGIRTTCGSKIHMHRIPSADAMCWRRLASEGALLLGKLNTQEFAAGVTTENDTFGSVVNPWNEDVISGGSSGGSAASVSAGMAAAALGTDTGGSIRVPAACCGVVGFKPTFGTISTEGIHPLSWTLDHVGPITRNVGDAAVLLEILMGTTGYLDAVYVGQEGSLNGLVMATPSSWIEDVDWELRKVFNQGLDVLGRRGAILVEPVDLPRPEFLASLNRIIAYSEGSQVHASLLSQIGNYGPLVKARMEAGRYILARDYLLAQQLRNQWCHKLAVLWRDVDVIVTPTLPCRTPLLGSDSVKLGKRDEALGNALVQYTAPFNLAGCPSVTVPCGFLEGLPVGMQIVGPPGSEDLLCLVAGACETDLRLRLKPPVDS